MSTISVIEAREDSSSPGTRISVSNWYPAPVLLLRRCLHCQFDLSFAGHTCLSIPPRRAHLSLYSASQGTLGSLSPLRPPPPLCTHSISKTIFA